MYYFEAKKAFKTLLSKVLGTIPFLSVTISTNNLLNRIIFKDFMLKINELRLKNESLKATEVAQKADLKRKRHIIIATK